MRFIFSATVLASLLLPSLSFGAGGEDVDASAPHSTIAVAYDLYAAGIPLGQITLSAQIDGEQYKAISTLETGGVVNILWKAKIEASTSGNIGHSLHPSLYYANSDHNGSRQEVTVTYRAGGADEARIQMPDDVKKDTLDPVSAMLSLALSAETDKAKPCGEAVPVYDGRRRYDVNLSFVRNTEISMDNGLYKGPVRVCKIAYKPVAGPKQRVLEKGNIPNLFLWMTEVPSSADPSRHYLVPLRIWVETELGMGVAVASKVTIDGKPMDKRS
jgi:Protein of unknown function (DUF3108)